MDSRWLEQCREGDSLAIERLIQTYQQDVYRLALSILDDPADADDATQEVFLSALRALESFRGHASFKTWLFSIAINVCRSRLQRHKRGEKLQLLLQSLLQRTCNGNILKPPPSTEWTDGSGWGVPRASSFYSNKIRAGHSLGLTRCAADC